MEDQDLVSLAIEIDDASARAQFLNERCGDNLDLRKRVERLLKKYEHSIGDSEIPPCPENVLQSSNSRRSLTEFGPYRIVRQLGQGGMGTVYLAEQTKPVRRQVAVKIIKPGLNSGQIIARFDAERQALAMMNHRHIAKVLDAGTADNGAPYFVMEFVEGQPITEYCDQHRLTLRERLTLFVSVCEAVQHAHMKGIIHRDLKPSNILVTDEDGKHMPKVIDFGLAKALQSHEVLTDQSFETEFGQILGTVQYMSPEQASMENVDIDTRTDVYSLGVILYEMLAGSTPIEKATLRQHAILRVLELIRDSEPPRPSRRLSTLGDQLGAISQNRQIAPLRLQEALRGELDWIIMRALEKNRDARFESAHLLAEDIRNYLNGDLVVARPPTTAYRVRKFVRKNWGLVTAVSVITALLLAGLLVTTSLYLRSEHHRIAAEKSAKRSADVLGVVQGAFGSFETSLGASHDILAKDVLLAAQEDLQTKVMDEEAKAAVLATLSQSFLGLGKYEEAIAAAQDSLTIRERILGATHPDTLTSTLFLTEAYSGINDSSDVALQLSRKILAAGKGENSVVDEAKIRARNIEARYFIAQSQFEEAVVLLQQNLDECNAIYPEVNEEKFVVQNNLASAYMGQDRLAEAIELFEQVLSARTELYGLDHRLTLTSMNNLGAALGRDGQTEDAIPLYEKAVAGRQALLGRDHPNTLVSLVNLAVAYRRIGRNDEAIERLKEVIGIATKRFGAEHPATIHPTINLASAYFFVERYDQAVRLYEQTLAILEDSEKPDLDAVARVRHSLGRALLEQSNDRDAEAFQLLNQSLVDTESILGKNHRLVLSRTKSAANAHKERRRFETAIKLYQRVLAVTLNNEAQHSLTIEVLKQLADAYAQSNQLQEEIPIRQDILERQSRKFGDDHLETHFARNSLAMAYEANNEPQAALPLSKAVAAAFQKQFGNQDPNTIQSQLNLASVLVNAQLPKEAAEVLETALPNARASKDKPDQNLAGALTSYGEALLRLERDEQAEAVLSESLKIHEHLPESWKTFHTQSLSGEANLRLKKANIAATQLRAAYDGLLSRSDDIPNGRRKVILSQAIKRLIELASSRNETDQVDEWQTRLDNL